MEDMKNRCTLCPHACDADRTADQPAGFCGMGWDVRIARAAPHFWEEPCISGTRGSGTVFFTGCVERCVYCQNRAISHIRVTPSKEASLLPGHTVRTEELAEVFLSLAEQGTHNINLVTPTHFSAQIARALTIAKNNGLEIPVVYNTGGYEKVETLKMLDGLVDIYLTDFQHALPDTGKRFSGVPDYPDVAEQALREMLRQTGNVLFEGGMDAVSYNAWCAEHETEADYDGPLMTRGTIVRHLLLPHETENARGVLRILKRIANETGGNSFYLSLLNQYTPVLPEGDAMRFPELTHRVPEEDYQALVDEAIALGFQNAFFQYGETASESFIPAFELIGKNDL